MESELPMGVSERWIIMGDVKNSTQFLNSLRVNLRGDLLFKTVIRYNYGFEKMYLTVQKSIKSTAMLGNTMGDGFLILGMHGHGDPHIKWEFPNVLVSCRYLKNEIDKILDETKNEIIKSFNLDNLGLPALSIKLCVNRGLIATNLAFNRVVGDCINYTSRILSCWDNFVEEDERIFLLTEDYFDLLPDDLKKVAEGTKLKQPATILDYPKHGEKDETNVYKIPVDEGSTDPEVLNFWGTFGVYLKKIDFTRDMGKLADDLYKDC